MDISPLLDLARSPVISAIVGGATGIAGGIFTNYFASSRERMLKSKATLAALKSEVLSILELIKHANYAEGMRQQMEKTQKTGKAHFFSVPVQIELFTKVYSANVANLGLLNPKIISPIVIFYASINALVMNLEHMKNKNDYPELVDNLIYIYSASIERLEIAVALGEKVVSFR